MSSPALAVVLVICIACLAFFVVPDILFQIGIVGTWQAEFMHDPAAVNKKQVKKITLEFTKNSDILYESVSDQDISRNTPEEQSSGHTSSTLNNKLHFSKKGDYLMVTTRARSTYIPFLAPFKVKFVENNIASAQVTYAAKIVSLTESRLTLQDPETGKEVGFARAPSVHMNTVTFAGEDGGLAGFQPQVARRKMISSSLAEEDARPVHRRMSRSALDSDAAPYDHHSSSIQYGSDGMTVTDQRNVYTKEPRNVTQQSGLGEVYYPVPHEAASQVSASGQ